MTRVRAAILALLILATAAESGLAEKLNKAGGTSEAGVYETEELAATYPEMSRGCGAELTYSGAYLADGKFYTNKFSTSLVQQETLAQGKESRPAEVPADVNLHSRERVVEQLRPGAKAIRKARGSSRISEWRDDLITGVYGREKSILAPQSLATDTKGRVIVSDPAAGAVHVLDRTRPFRIVAGPQYHLHTPGAVATDSHDNIYVADVEEGVIVEFDPSGQFVREIGKIAEHEGIFYTPVGLGVDETDRLYVADSGREMLLVLDNNGRVLQKIGGRRKRWE